MQIDGIIQRASKYLAAYTDYMMRLCFDHEKLQLTRLNGSWELCINYKYSVSHHYKRMTDEVG